MKTVNIQRLFSESKRIIHIKGSQRTNLGNFTATEENANLKKWEEEMIQANDLGHKSSLCFNHHNM